MAFQKKLIVSILIFIASILIGTSLPGSVLIGDLNMIDEGQFAAWANHMLLGKKMFQDIYIVYGPLHVYPIYLLFKFFEPSAFIVRLFLTIGGSIGIVAIYFIIDKLLINKFLKILTILFFLFVPLLNLRISITLWGLYMLMIAQELRRKKLVYLLLGILASVNFLVSQDFGTFLILTIIFHFCFLFIKSGFREIYKNILAFLAGIAGIFILFIIWSGYEGWLRDYIKTLIDVSLSLIGVNVPNGKGFPNYLKILFTNNEGFISGLLSYEILLYTSLIVLSASVFVIFHLLLAKKFTNRIYCTILITLLGFLLFAVLITRNGIGHYFYSLSPIIILCFTFIDHLLKQSKKIFLTSSILILIISIFLLRIVYINNPGIRKVLNSNSYTQVLKNDVPRIGILGISKNQKSQIKSIQNFVENNTKVSDYVFLFSDEPMLYMLVNRLNPTKYDLPFAANSIEKRHDMLNDLVEKAPKYIFINKNIWDVDGISNSRRLPEVYKFILKNYSLETEMNGMLIYHLTAKNEKN